MMTLIVNNSQQQLRLTHKSGRLQFGRIARSAPDWVTLIDDYVSREQMEIEEREGRLTVKNLSRRVPIALSSGRVLGPGDSTQDSLPLAMQIGSTTIRCESEAPVRPREPEPVSGGTLMTVRGPVSLKSGSHVKQSLSELPGVLDADTLLTWFETIVSVHKAAAGTNEFYRQTAQAVVDLIGLDYGMVLLRNQNTWQAAAAATAPNSHVRTAYSRTVLDRVVDERRTFYQLPEINTTASLIDISAVVASPIFGADSDEVVGALYGARSAGRKNIAVEIKPLEAQLMQVLAAAVGAGLARAEAAQRHAQFEQFFSAELAQALEDNPSLLDGDERTISVLFADIRNFSRISEKMAPVQSVKLVESVMDRLTNRVREHDGVLVAYLGDGLLAMWNAPLDQPDHACQACRAGLDLISEMPSLSEQWEPVIGEPLRLGVGVNTGPAIVGNTGSKYKMHYGPLGHAVNLASRVEGATKQLGVPMLITEETRKGLDISFATRRVCRVHLQGIQEPTNLFELRSQPVPDAWFDHRDAYEAAFEDYENRRWAQACHRLQPFLAKEGDYDVPALTLLGRCLECLRAPPASFDPVWELRGK